jgi:transposase
MYFKQGMAQEEIKEFIPSPRSGWDECISLKTVNSVIQYYEDWGTVEPPKRKQRMRAMPPGHAEALIGVATLQPYLYLSEIAEELREKVGTEYSGSQCYSELRDRGFSLKKMRKTAKQRDERKRDEYWLRIVDILKHRDQLCFADETGKDSRVLRRRRGWGGKGLPVEVEELHVNGKMVSILGLYGIDGMIDFDWKIGGYKGDDFFDAACGMILPHLGNYERCEKNSILVLDNCGIHKTRLEEFQAMVDECGAKLVFLAPYCPIDNPIEKVFNVFKACWRKNAAWLEVAEAECGTGEAIEWCFNNCYKDARASAVKTYVDCGYIY